MGLKVLDLFCGCGGSTLGFTKAGFDVIAGIDIWDKAIDTYKKNNDHISICQDLQKYSPEQFSKDYNINHIDIIINSPPCQSYSMAGKRKSNDPRNSLFMEFIKYLDYYNPKAFIMENVMGILSYKNENNEKVIDIITSILSKNYNIKICKLMASDFDVPQNRKRVIIIGINKNLNILPTSPIPLYDKENRPPVKNILLNKNDVEEKYYLSEKAIQGIKNKKERMKKEGKGFGAQFLKLDKPSYTIPSRYWKDGYDALVKYNEKEIRRLKPIELSRIQSFPDNYEFIGSKKDIIIQIGNAVPVNLAKHIGLHLKNLLGYYENNKKYNIDELKKLKLKNLKLICKENKIKGYSKLKKLEIINLILNNIK